MNIPACSLFSEVLRKRTYFDSSICSNNWELSKCSVTSRLKGMSLSREGSVGSPSVEPMATYTHTGMHMHTHMQTCMHTNKHNHGHKHIHTRKHARTHTHKHAHIQDADIRIICRHTHDRCKHAHTRTHISADTHAHVYAHWPLYPLLRNYMMRSWINSMKCHLTILDRVLFQATTNYTTGAHFLKSN